MVWVLLCESVRAVDGLTEDPRAPAATSLETKDYNTNFSAMCYMSGLLRAAENVDVHQDSYNESYIILYVQSDKLQSQMSSEVKPVR